MADRFIPLEAFLCAASAATIRNVVETIASNDAGAGANEQCRCTDELAAVRRYHAALSDALDAALDALLRDVARDVLGRELTLAPVDVAAIATKALKRYQSEGPLRLRVHPDDVAALSGATLNVVADAGLRRGDVAIDLRAGTIDATLGARLECVLEQWNHADCF